MNEFSLIDEFFKSIPTKRNDVVLGIGDDAACLQIPSGMNLLVSTDTLVSGIHFLPEWNAYDIACKAVRVNVSDMAAMAAEPCWISLALTLPKMDSNWLHSFSKGIKDSLDQFHMDLIGGDTTHGPLSITITIMGLAPPGQHITRSGAKPDDLILVSGELGAAALALKVLDESQVKDEDRKEFTQKLLHPQPRVDLIPVLRKYASSAIDISDGFSADLNHICEASGVGACLNQDELPIHPLLECYSAHQAMDLALTGGDDYELCFTVPRNKLEALMTDLKKMGLKSHPVGVIEQKLGLRLKTADGRCEELKPGGYSHF